MRQKRLTSEECEARYFEHAHKELLDSLAKHIWLTIAALNYADDRGSIDHWVQVFLSEHFDAKFDGV